MTQYFILEGTKVSRTTLYLFYHFPGFPGNYQPPAGMQILQCSIGAKLWSYHISYESILEGDSVETYFISIPVTGKCPGQVVHFSLFTKSYIIMSKMAIVVITW